VDGSTSGGEAVFFLTNEEADAKHEDGKVVEADAREGDVVGGRVDEQAQLGRKSRQ